MNMNSVANEDAVTNGNGTNEGDVYDDGRDAEEVLLMVQIGAGFFVFGFTFVKMYKVVKKLFCGDDNSDVDPETGM